jgi:hypothetical protein
MRQSAALTAAELPDTRPVGEYPARGARTKIYKKNLHQFVEG